MTADTDFLEHPAAPGSRLAGLRGRLRHSDPGRRFRCKIPETEPALYFTAHKPTVASINAKIADKTGQALLLGSAALLAETCEGIFEADPSGALDETGQPKLRTIHPDGATVVKIDPELQQLLESPYTGANLVVDLCGEAGTLRIQDKLTDWAGWDPKAKLEVLPEA